MASTMQDTTTRKSVLLLFLDLRLDIEPSLREPTLQHNEECAAGFIMAIADQDSVDPPANNPLEARMNKMKRGEAACR